MWEDIKFGMAALAWACVLLALSNLSIWDRPQQTTMIQLAPVESVATPQRAWVLISEKIKWCKLSRSCLVMAEAIVYEARSEPAVGQYAVGWVIRNRVESSYWRNTVSSVVYQSKQFSYTADKHSQRKPTKIAWTNAYIVGYDVLNDKVESPVGNATHYYSTSMLQKAPRWAKNMNYIADIANHKFLEEIR